MKQVYVKTRIKWRQWLAENHASADTGIWLIFYKQETGKPTLNYDEAVEEALCFGWIDSIIRSIDAGKYARKFMPRKLNSKWSELNKKRVKKVIRLGLK